MDISRNAISDAGLKLVGDLLKDLHSLSYLKA